LLHIDFSETVLVPGHFLTEQPRNLTQLIMSATHVTLDGASMPNFGTYAAGCRRIILEASLPFCSLVLAHLELLLLSELETGAE
jgi:hypothetical protein